MGFLVFCLCGAQGQVVLVHQANGIVTFLLCHLIFWDKEAHFFAVLYNFHYHRLKQIGIILLIRGNTISYLAVTFYILATP